MAQHAILRFEKHKGHPAGPLEAHHERKKEQYASNPDIDTSRSRYNFHIVKPEGRYYHFIQSRIEQAGCRTRKDSTRLLHHIGVKIVLPLCQTGPVADDFFGAQAVVFRQRHKGQMQVGCFWTALPR